MWQVKGVRSAYRIASGGLILPLVTPALRSRFPHVVLVTWPRSTSGYRWIKHRPPLLLSQLKWALTKRHFRSPTGACLGNHPLIISCSLCTSGHVGIRQGCLLFTQSGGLQRALSFLFHGPGGIRDEGIYSTEKVSFFQSFFCLIWKRTRRERLCPWINYTRSGSSILPRKAFVWKESLKNEIYFYFTLALFLCLTQKHSYLKDPNEGF